MAESSRTHRFLTFLSRIRSTRPLDRRDSQSITHLAVNEHGRKEQRIHYTNQEAVYEEFRATGFKTFPDEDAGLHSIGWTKLPSAFGPVITEGGYGIIRMAYKLADRGTPLESRHLSIAKIQRIDQTTWIEVEVLKGLVHENIVDLYGVFAVDPKWRSEYAENYPTPVPERRVLWMLLEYANAGDLFKEIERYELQSIPEDGARYYMLQVCAGLQLHSLQKGHPSGFACREHSFEIQAGWNKSLHDL